MTLQYVVIYECFNRVRFISFLLSFDFLVEQSHFSELVVTMFHTVYFYASQFGFLFYGFIHISCSNAWLRCMLIIHVLRRKNNKEYKLTQQDALLEDSV
jgi:hypothetical protein